MKSFYELLMEKKANIVKEAAPMWLQVLRGLRGSKAAKSQMTSVVKRYMGDGYHSLLRNSSTKGYPALRGVSRDLVGTPLSGLGRNDQMSVNLTRMMRNDLRGNTKFLTRNAKGEYVDNATGLRQRGGLFDEFMATNTPSRNAYAVGGRVGIPKRYSIDNINHADRMKGIGNGEALYSPFQNAIYDNIGRAGYKAMSGTKMPTSYDAFSAMGKNPNAIRHSVRRHELSHWKQSDLPMDQLQRNARYADTAISNASRETGLRLASPWEAGIKNRPRAVIEGFNNVQAAAGNGIGASRFRMYNNFDPINGWGSGNTPVPNTLLYNGRAGLNQMIGRYNLPTFDRPYLP